MRVAASLVSISLLSLPFLQLPAQAGLSIDHSLVAQKEQVPQRRVTDYYPDDPLWKRLDAENKDVINHFGFNALYKLMVYRRRLRRGVDAVGLEIALPDQKENPITDTDWFLLMNTSQVLNMLYPQELEEIRRYGFDAFRIANIRATLIEDQLKKFLSVATTKDAFSKAFARNRAERIDQAIDGFMGKPENLQKASNYEDIASLIEGPQDLSPQSLDFLVTYSFRLLLDDDYDRSLAVARQVSGLALEKWGADSFASYAAVEKLVGAENVVKSQSVSGRGEFKYTLSEKLLASVDSLIALTGKWWGPASPKLIPLLVNKAEFIERDEQISGVQTDAQVIALMKQAEEIYLGAKQKRLFPEDNAELAADQSMRIVTMNSLFADIRLGYYDSAFQRILSFKSYPFHRSSKGITISFGQLFADLVNSGKYAQAIEFAEGLLKSHDEKEIQLSRDEITSIVEDLAYCYVFVGRFDDFDDLYSQLDQSDPTVDNMRSLSLLNRGIVPQVQYPLPSLAFTEDGFSFEAAVMKNMIAMIREGFDGNYVKSAEIGEAVYSAVASNSSSVDPGDVSKLLSVIYFAMGDKDKGTDYLRKTFRHKKDSHETIDLNDRIGTEELKLNLVEEKLEQASVKAESIFDIWLQQLHGELAMMPSQERTAYLQSGIASIQDSEALNLLLSDSGFNAKKPQLPLYYILNRKGLLEELEQKQRQLLNADPSTQALIRDIRSRQKFLADGQLQGEDLNALQLEINVLERQLYRELPRFEPRIFSVKDVSQALPKDGALVEFIRYQWSDPVKPLIKDEHYAAFVLRPNGRISLVQLGESAAIDSNIAIAINALEQQLSDSEALLKQAFDPVLSPLTDELSGVRVLYLSPDGELNRLPFAAASLGRAGSMLTDDMTVRILTTGRELVQLAERQDSAVSSAVVIANPAFDRAGIASRSASSVRSASLPKDEQSSSLGTQRALGLDQIWSRLDYTQEEGQVAADLLAGSLLSGEQASTTNVKAIRSPRVAHFATHGYFLPDEERTPRDVLSVGSFLPLKTQPTTPKSNPLLRSGIVMAGANQPDANPADDGYLTALEVLQLDWEGTELVVVSACESGRGLVKRGEGMYGLKRAFAVAGARSSLLSLWKVDDQATAAFMRSFYQHLKAGKGKGDALAETQKEFRNHPIAGWRHPYVWAAFQLSGDWGPVKGL